MHADPRSPFFISGGTLPADAASYVERNADAVLLASILEGRFCYVLNSRQMGKSSLSVYTIGKLNALGIRTAFLDLTRIGGKSVTAEQWYAGIALELARELDLQLEVLTYWRGKASVGPMQRLFGAIHDVMLRDWDDTKPQLVIFIDEIDATRVLPFDTDEFFAGIRECFNRRVVDLRFRGLVYCLLGVAVPSDLIRNPAMTPFNIGERIFVEDFTLAEMRAFARGLGARGSELVKRVYYWTAGHPFLSQSICRSLAAQIEIKGVSDVDEVVRREYFDYKARDSNVNLADVANIALHYEDSSLDADGFRANLLSVYQRILRGQEVPDDESNRVAVVLKLSGLVKADGKRLRVRNRIYRHVFDRVWVQEQMPGQELRRQEQSFRLGVLRTAVVAGVVLALVGASAVFAWTSRLEAIEARNKLDYQLYVSDMNSLRLFQDGSDTTRVEAILERHERSPYRGFEWGYWLARLHDSNEEYTLDYRAPGKREEGHVSSDGTQICVVDALTQTATVVDRATKKVLVSRSLESGDRVVAGQSRWVILRKQALDVIDLFSGKRIASFADPGATIVGVAAKDHCDIVATIEAPSGSQPARTLNLWSLSIGKKVFTHYAQGELGSWLEVTPRGDRVLFAMRRESKLEIALLDWRAGSARRFTIPQEELLAFLDDEVGALVRRQDQRLLRRDLGTGLATKWGAFTDRVQSAVPLPDNRVAVSFAGGLSTLSSALGKPWPLVRRNVFALQRSSVAGEYLAASTSVRVYRVDDPGSPRRVAEGYRITRYGDGEINVYRDNPRVIVRVDENTYGQLGELAPPKDDYRDFTYNGHWALETGPSGNHDVLAAADGRNQIKLPWAPSIWSASIDASVVALWEGGKGLQVISGASKSVKWSLPDLRQMDGMWVSRDGTRVLIVRDLTRLIVFDAETGKLVVSSRTHNAGPVNVCFSADGRRFFTTGGDGRTVMWDLAKAEVIQEFDGNALETITSADLSPDGKRVVTTSQSGSWQLWDTKTGVQLMDTPASKQPLTSALFTADGRRIITAGSDQNVRIWTSIDRDPATYIKVDEALLRGVHSQAKESNIHAR